METNKTKIKVCGLKHPLEVKCAADYGANWYGMIFEKVSPRFIKKSFSKTDFTTE